MTDDLEDLDPFTLDDLAQSTLGRPHEPRTFKDRMEASYSAASLRKARKLIESEGLRPLHELGLFLARGSSGEEYHVRVFIPDGETLAPAPESLLPYVTCTCPNGESLGGHPRCYHTAAALYALIEDPYNLTIENE